MSRLCLIAPWLENGGADKFNLDALEQLAQRGWQCAVITTAPSHNPSRQRFAALAQVMTLPDAAKPARLAEAMREAITQFAPDALMISHSEFAYRLLPWLRFCFPTLPILDFCHVEEEHWQNGGYPRLSIEAQKHLDLTLVSSAHLQKWMVERGGNAGRIRVCHTCVDTQKWQPDPTARDETRARMGILPDMPVILFAGRMAAQKRPLMALEALRLLKESNRFLALLAGDGPLIGQAREFVQKHGLQGCIRVMGHVPAQNMRALMNACDVLFLPSANEGISLAIYEATALGLVPLSADVGGQRELVTSDCGVLLVPGEDTANAYANALRDLIGQPEKMAQMGQNARARVAAQFDIHLLGDALERAMKQANANCAMRHELVSKGEALTAQKAAARFAHMQRARAAARYAPGVEFAAKLARKLKSL
ncbi:MAG TPA: glycosyltransferase family 4 protein [Thermoflexales bacterium]|nr:glycosyltransferase family 4 protein [Thermoflexales bacterium]HQW33926.1 glycosyltransferase family 4 protein [Thermoflexales bacterium]HQZ21253.1 glycosyltransferase family 4 protein [Thermoflexales bacterium]HQZ98697.1 glycosyltransferase family 4 protein [Thermoflexales bacterium]